MGSLSQTIDNRIYLYIVSKRKSKSYKQVAMPGHYSDTVREESRLAYAVLAFLLRTQFNLKFDAQDILVTKNGKPYQKDNKYYFSYAHCPDFIACAVGFEEIGVDIEQFRKVPEKLYPKFLTKTEMSKQVDPLWVWVIKEAYSKLHGLGLRMSFSRQSASELQRQYPNVLLQSAGYLCALFHTDKKTKIIFESDTE